MCLSSVIQQNSQIERYVENGMPQKIIKSVEYTLKKRAAELSQLEQRSVEPIPKMCGRFRKMQQQQQQQQQEQQINKTHITTENSCTDAFAWATQKTRKSIQQVHMAIAKLQQHKLYTVLTKTTQPAHLVAVCILALLLLTVGPHLIDNRTNAIMTKTPTPKSSMASASNHIADAIFISMENSTTTFQINHHNNNMKSTTDNNNNNNTLAMIAYLGAFATHFGTQIWMTFVSGLSLYFSLPRHTFGQCQQILFPKYFALNAILSITMLVLFVKYFTRVWTTATCIQFGALALCAVIEVVIRFYLAPPMLRLMHEKYKIEGAIGSGQEVGTLVQGDLAQCPHYQRIHKMFRRIHMTIAIGNMIVLLATCLQLYFLAAKIQIS